MTGSTVFLRQHSSAADSSNGEKMKRPSLRRWSSADTLNLLEVIPDDQQNIKELLSARRNQTPSDFDSGVEDNDHQNGNDDEPFGDFEATPDEVIEEKSVTPVPDKQHSHEDDHLRLFKLGSCVRDIEKKEFCADTSVVFHAECALINYAINSIDPNIRYHLFADEEVSSNACTWPGFSFIKVDNAKAQFHCHCCGHLWTSARARILFKVSVPQQFGFIVLRILGQRCNKCHTLTDALWYMEEVCRVMKNLSNSIFAEFYPHMVDLKNQQNTNINKVPQRLRHDPNQRQANMRAKHNRHLCVACEMGICYS